MCLRSGGIIHNCKSAESISESPEENSCSVLAWLHTLGLFWEGKNTYWSPGAEIKTINFRKTLSGWSSYWGLAQELWAVTALSVLPNPFIPRGWACGGQDWAVAVLELPRGRAGSAFSSLLLGKWSPTGKELPLHDWSSKPHSQCPLICRI